MWPCQTTPLACVMGAFGDHLLAAGDDAYVSTGRFESSPRQMQLPLGQPSAGVRAETMEDRLIREINHRNLDGITVLLAKGANPTQVTKLGRSPIGHAADLGCADMLEVMLNSCYGDEDPASNEAGVSGDTGKADTDTARDGAKVVQTPDGMEGLQWEEEIQSVPEVQPLPVLREDDCSELYRYYAKIFETTGDMLTNTIRTKEPHCQDGYNFAPIHYAVVKGHADCVELLLKHNCPVDQMNREGMTPLHLAVRHPHIVKKLLDHGANPNQRNLFRFETPLHLAVKESEIDVVKQLLDAGADINAVNSNDRTPLILAASAQNVHMLRLLLDRNCVIQAQDCNGRTALHVSMLWFNEPCVELLLSRGARCMPHDYMIHYCVMNDKLKMLQTLVKHDQAGINIRDRVGRTAVDLAIRDMKAPIVALLLDNGALLSSPDWFRHELQSLIQRAMCRELFPPTALVLFQHGVDMDTCNNYGETLMMQAIRLEKFQVAEFLIKEGAAVNAGKNPTDYSYVPVRSTSNINLLRLLFNAGMKFDNIKMHDIRLKPAPWPRPDECVADFISASYTNPMSLKQLARIAVRTRLIERVRAVAAQKLQDRHTVVQHLDGSMLKHSVRATGLPYSLLGYVYNFTDLPAVQDIWGYFASAELLSHSRIF